MLKKTSLISIYIVMLTNLAVASGGASQGAAQHGPPKAVLYYAINLFILMAVIIYFSKDKVAGVFKDRLDDYHKQANESKRIKKELEDKIAEVKRLAEKLITTKQESLSKADTEAQSYYKKEIDKANAQAAAIVKDAEARVGADFSKMMEKLRVEALDKAFGTAEKSVTSFSDSDKLKVNERVDQRLKGAQV